jgi:hypothetical protein
MSVDLLPGLKLITPAVITEAARRSLGLPEFIVEAWSASPLSHEKVIETTGGLFRFSGVGQDNGETKAWSAVLKIVIQPEHDCQEPQALCYWRREMLAYQDKILPALSNVIRAPHCFGVHEHARSGWIWLENVQETVQPTWTIAHFQQAARRLGQFAGTTLAGQSVPVAGWLCSSFFRSLFADHGWWAGFINPASPDNAWQRPFVQAVYPDHLRAKVLQIWAQKWQWIEANERLPQVFCHNDAHRRNLILLSREQGPEELVMLDWAVCGPGALGNDLGELIGTSLSYFALDPSQAGGLEAAVLEGYLGGLRETGWSGDEWLPRLGYLISLALYWGGTLPCEVALAQPEAKRVNLAAKYGRSIETLLSGWTCFAEFALERAEEARFLIKSMF